MRTRSMIGRSRLRCGRRVVLVALAILVLGPSPAAAYRQGEASRFIAGLGTEAIRMLRATKGRLADREAALRRILTKDFDIAFIGRFVLGRYWRALTPAQRNAYLEAFGGYVLRTYSMRLGGYAGETLVVLGERPAGKKDVVVTTRIDRPSGPPTRVEWRVRTVGGPLRIVDVAVEAVSLVITQRAEFASVIERHGFTALVAMLRARAAPLPAVSG